MSTPAVVLEMIGESLLGSLSTTDVERGLVDRPRVAREFWSAWTRGRDGAARAADWAALRSLSASEQQVMVAGVVRQILPGRADPMQQAMARYLGVLPFLLSASPRPIEQADDLLRRLPARVPTLRIDDRPEGVGDLRLTRPVVITSGAEVWQAVNPRLPRRKPSLLAFYPALAADSEAKDRLAAYLASLESSRVLIAEQTFLDAKVPCVAFGMSDRALLTMDEVPVEQARLRFANLLRAVAELHRRVPTQAVGPLEMGQLLAGEEAEVHLLLPNPPIEGSPRDDVLSLGQIGRYLVGGDERLADVIASCVAADPLHRPADAGAVLARLDPTGEKQAAPLPAARARPRRGADVNRILGELQHAAPEAPKLVTNGVGMRFVLIQPATFRMGSPIGEIGRRDNEGPVHDVVFSRPFYIAVHPTTQEQYRLVMGENPSRFQAEFGGGPTHPVECVSYDDSVAFCRRLEQAEEGRRYRLPSEAEWEYACRAGSATAFSFGDALSSSQASFDGAHPYARTISEAERAASITRSLTVQRTTPVGTYEANHFGLYDMHGNIWEWCADWYDGAYYKECPRQDPPGPTQGLYRVLRGGSWKNQAVTCRSAYRNALTPNQRQPTIGFRVVLECPT